MIFVNYPGHFAAGLLVTVFAVLMFLAFAAQQSRRAKRSRPLLLVLQYAAVFVLLLILWNPSRSQSKKVISRNSVLVLFDTSESMSVVDDKTTARLDKAVDVFKRKFRPSESEGPNYRIYGFDSQSYYSDSVDSLRRWGRQTDMHSALAAPDRYEPAGAGGDTAKESGAGPGKLAGVVVFTDGQADDKNIQAYMPPGEKAPKLVLVGVGSKNPQPDVAVRSIKAPSRVGINSAYKVQVVVEARHISSGTVMVELLRDNEVIASRQLSANAPAAEAIQEFLVAADVPGDHVLLARAKITGEEVNAANNVRSTTVQVVEDKKLRVLLYSQVANFDVGKVRQSLARDKKVELDFCLDAIKNPAPREEARPGRVKLPQERAEFYRYDVIVLGACAADSLTEAQIEGLYGFVVERGGGLVLLPGKADYSAAAWKNAKIRTLIPVHFGASLQKGSPGGGQGPTDDAGPAGAVLLTPEGLESGIITEANLKDYGCSGCLYYGNIDKKPAGSTLACVNNEPAIIVHRVGRGRVCLVNVSELFRWYREDLEGGLLCKLMTGLTGYVGRIPSPEAGIELFAERAVHQPARVRFEAYVQDSHFNPVSGARVLLKLGGEVLRMHQTGEGRYIAEVDNITGEVVIATAQAEMGGVFLGEKTAAVNLLPVPGEMDNVELDSSFLQALAKRLGGVYLNIDDVDKAAGPPAGGFEATTIVASSTGISSVWPRWSLLVGLCLLLSVNWFLRRAVGLV